MVEAAGHSEGQREDRDAPSLTAAVREEPPPNQEEAREPLACDQETYQG